jgi:hypothetical protein
LFSIDKNRVDLNIRGVLANGVLIPFHLYPLRA